MRTIATIALAILGLGTARAEESHIPGILRDAVHLSAARQARVDAEIALKETMVASKRLLLHDGHAAPLEVDTAQLELRQLRCLRDAITAYQQSVSQLVAACSDGVAPIAYDGPPRSDTVQRLTIRIADRRAAAQGKLNALRAEAEFLRQLLQRLRQANDGSLGWSREIQLNELRLAVVSSRIAMQKAERRFSANLERLDLPSNRKGFPIKSAEGTIVNPRQLGDVLQAAWELQRTQAQRDAVAERLAMQLEYQARFVKLDQQDAGRPGETRAMRASAETTRQMLAALERTLDALQRKLTARFAGDTAERFIDIQRATSPRQLVHLPSQNDLTATRSQVARLRRLAADSPEFAQELHRAELELAIGEAQQDVRRKAEQDRYADRLTAILGESNARTTSSEFLPGEAESKAAMRAKIKLATCRLQLLQWKLNNLQPLRDLGYATWMEEAALRRDLAIAQAEREAASEEFELFILESQRMQRMRHTQMTTPQQTARVLP